MRGLRAAEFEAGRRAAVRSLEQIGWSGRQKIDRIDHVKTVEEHWPVGRNPDRSPSWPDGFVGSISHSRRWIWAAAAQADKYLSLGIDTEILLSPEQAGELKSDVGTAAEWELLQRTGLAWPQAVTLLFSAKEAFFKCWFPLTGTFWEFADVELLSITTYMEDDFRHRNDLTRSQLADGHLQIRSCNSSANFTQPLGPPQTSCVLFQVRQPDVFTITSVPVKSPDEITCSA